MSAGRQQQIQDLLADHIDATFVQVKDQSHLHAGHAGAKEGKGHFEVTIVSDQFEGLGRLARHRRIFDALGSLMESDIHALSIHAYTPSERG